MSHLLYRLGSFAARRPWAVIGSWLVVSVLVIGASSSVGRVLEDSFQAPGVDSQKATELLSAAGSDQAGLTAQLVVTPREDGATFFDSPGARTALTDVVAGVTALPNVLRTSDPAAAIAAGRASADQQRGRVRGRPRRAHPHPLSGARRPRQGRPSEPQDLRRAGRRGLAAAAGDGR